MVRPGFTHCLNPGTGGFRALPRATANVPCNGLPLGHCTGPAARPPIPPGTSPPGQQHPTRRPSVRSSAAPGAAAILVGYVHVDLEGNRVRARACGSRSRTSSMWPALPTTAGSRAVAEPAGPAAADAPCLAGLRAAMARGEACLAGKTNLHELAYGISGINARVRDAGQPARSGSGAGRIVQRLGGGRRQRRGRRRVRLGHRRVDPHPRRVLRHRRPQDHLGPYTADRGMAARAEHGHAWGRWRATWPGWSPGWQLLEPGFTCRGPAPRVGRPGGDGADPAIDAAVDAALAADRLEGDRRSCCRAGRGDDRRDDRARRRGVGVRRALARSAPGQDRPADVLARLRAGSDDHPGRSSARPGSRRHGGARRCRSCGTRLTCSPLPTLLGFPPALDDVPGDGPVSAGSPRR